MSKWETEHLVIDLSDQSAGCPTCLLRVTSLKIEREPLDTVRVPARDTTKAQPCGHVVSYTWHIHGGVGQIELRHRQP